MGPRAPRTAMSGGLTREEVQALYAQFSPVVYRRARVLLGRDADAWDAVQEVFEKMLSQGATFRGEARPMTWVYRVTTNVALNLLRSRRVREPALAVVSDEPGVGPEAVEARMLLAKWLAHLTEREVEVAALLYLDGLTQQEVADVLGLSRKTIVREAEELRQKLEALSALPGGGT